MNLKIGDEVVIISRYRNKEIAKVEKITKTGLIKVKGILYNKNGEIRSNDRWSDGRITILTEELKKEIIKEKTIIKANRLLNNLKIDYNIAVKIIKLLEEEK